MSNFKRASKNLTTAQYNECRKWEAAGITTYSQAVKSFERGTDKEFRAAYAAKVAAKTEQTEAE